MQFDDLPNELLIEVLLKTQTEKELIELCSASKRMYDLCKTESVAKHIITNFIKIVKPKVFATYQGFLKHYIKRAKIVHKDTVKFDSVNFYRSFDAIVRHKAKSDSWAKSFEAKFGKLSL